LKEQVQKGKSRVDKNREVIQTIAEKTDDIQSFIATINSIAAQTNLLAMNAAIEAAHAGDAGRGFSVVADEVRKLSSNTSENARNIRENLMAVVTSINEAQEISSAVSSAFQEMLTGIEDFAEGVSEVTNGLIEISAGTEQVDKALSELVSSTGEVNESAASITDSTGTIFDSIRKVTNLS
ncbi:MAG: methyl-accepting chemotaxis protein, partial [Sediminispirochaetaceae bacterium]